MKRVGFIREKNDIKFLILYCMKFLREPISLENLADIALCDGGFGYFEYAEAVGELVQSGHIAEDNSSGSRMLTITALGMDTAAAFERQLPISVRESARKSAARVVREIYRSAAIQSETIQRTDGTRAVRIAFVDAQTPVFQLELIVLSEEQAQLIRKNFHENAEKIYDGVLSALFNDYSESEDSEE